MRDNETVTLFPVAVVAAGLMSAVPLGHPLDTCTQWLMEWGRLYPTRGWILVHVAAAAGFLLTGGWALLAGALVRRSPLSLLAAATLAGGALMLAVTYPMHATVVGSLGQSFNSSKDHATRVMLQTVADSWIAYDVAVGGMASTLFSAGAFALTVHLWRERALATPAAIVLGGLSGVWAAQYYHVFNRLGFSLPESWRWTCTCVWLVAAGWLADRVGRSRGGPATTPNATQESPNSGERS